MKVVKAGCILINPKTKEIGLVYRKEYNDYSFPKGHVEKDEKLIDCAIRETNEETKRDCLLYMNKEIAIDHYQQKEGEIEVYYYLAIDNGKSDNTSLDTHDLVWIPYQEVEKKLSYDSLKEVWKQAIKIINKMN